MQISNTQTAPRRKFGDVRAVRETYDFGTTLAYQLLKEQKIRAKKLGRKTLFDFESIDEYIASLPSFQNRA